MVNISNVSLPDKVNDRRRFKRYYLDVQIWVQGMDHHGNLVEEETFTLDISKGGAAFISTQEYDIKKPLFVKVNLIHPLGEDVKDGDWTITGRIVRVQDTVRNPGGILKIQRMALNFNGLLGEDSPKTDAWTQVID